MTVISSETLHTSTVAIEGRAVMIEGRSGSGKSDLALRLIDRGAKLVSDDYTIAKRKGKLLLASPPVNIAGKIEVRGIGLVEMEHTSDVPVALVVQLFDTVDRMPLTPELRVVAGISVPVMKIAPMENSAPIKVELAMKTFGLDVG
ncbi:HPr kinase/phosphorylase [Rhizorhapis sp. SPR117]|uniref:HPr kinase/phosphorylase n=1 Tax=Rhizorhapis sp. SPR117 TaxID=2912611 RepID=UPI001F2E7B15|nr:HPr kinase/phosphatase C-terminal domain-containing protein [Rhizorhapis sp. SPR117]